MSEGERSLAAAVVLQAIEDVKSPGPARPRKGADPKRFKEYRQKKRQWELDRAYAIQFLTAPNGEWAASRARWCALANVDPDAVRESTLQLVAA